MTPFLSSGFPISLTSDFLITSTPFSEQDKKSSSLHLVSSHLITLKNQNDNGISDSESMKERTQSVKKLATIFGRQMSVAKFVE